MAKNEFLRQKNGKKSARKIMYDLIGLLIPVGILVAGIFIATQKFSEMVGYDFTLVNDPIFVTPCEPAKGTRPLYRVHPDSRPPLVGFSRKLSAEKPYLVHYDYKTKKWIPVYPIFNPFVIMITMFTQPFNQKVQNAISAASVPIWVSAAIAIFTWLVLAVIRTIGMNKNENFYGTARWGTKKDLKKFGLCEKHGVVLCQQYSAESKAIINKAGNFGLKMIRTSRLVCHAGTSHTLMIAPTRSGKGVGSIVPTCVTYRESMIIFDPKGELYNMTAGYRKRFGRVIKFSPVQMETACFNPLEEVELDENAFRDIGTILTNLFQKSDKGSDSNSDFFDNNARDLLTGVIFHVLSAVDGSGEMLYPKKERNIAGVLRVLSRAASGDEDEGGEDGAKAGEALLDEMVTSRHLDKNGKESEFIHGIVLDVAMSAKQQHAKVRADIMQTIQSKLNLFRDPFIKHVTSKSDFKLQDFYDSKEPISLYLTLPFGDIDRIMPIFQLIIDFILRRFSSGELKAGEKEKKLKHPILFLLDEFPTLGNMKFLATSMGILAGYGLRFFIVVQAYQQLVKIYGQENTFIDNCRYIIIYAPNNPQDAEKFSKMMGKESATKESLSVSGSRFAVALNNLNASAQEIARDLINPDELQKLPYTDCIVLGHNMPPYMGKKCAFYDDDRFSWKVFFENVDTGEVKTGFKAPYDQKDIDAETAGLPSQAGRTEELETEASEEKEPEAKAEKEAFDPIAFIQQYKADDETGEVEEWDAPFTGEDDESSPPPRVSKFSPEDFDEEAEIVEDEK